MTKLLRQHAKSEGDERKQTRAKQKVMRARLFGEGSACQRESGNRGRGQTERRVEGRVRPESSRISARQRSRTHEITARTGAFAAGMALLGLYSKVQA